MTYEQYQSASQMPMAQYIELQKAVMKAAKLPTTLPDAQKQYGAIAQEVAVGSSQSLDRALQRINQLIQGVWMVENELEPLVQVFVLTCKTIDGANWSEFTGEVLQDRCSRVMQSNISQEEVKKKALTFVSDLQTN